VIGAEMTTTESATPVSAANHALALEEFRQGKTVLASTPYKLTLETTSRCNLQCVMCVHAIDGVSRPKHLDESISARLAPYIARAGDIQLHGIGEPLNSPAFWRCLGDLPAVDECASSINTNFTVLNDAQLERLLNSQIHFINVSLDAATPLTYARIRGFDFEKVLNNIRRFVKARTAMGKTHPLLLMNMTLMRSNIEELSDFIRLAKELGANQVCAWQLNRWPAEEMARFRVTRGDWTFDYASEGLWNFPELSNRCIAAAETLAKELELPFTFPTAAAVYFPAST
jgi:MoaA/NifB/PqqE/SkfB family radical SAM enzyme